jgi:hypothetical protein
VSFRDGKFGHLTVRKQIASDIYACDCSCGNSILIWRSLLISRVQRDCGMCRRFTRSGRFKSRVSVHGHVRNFVTRSGRDRRYATGEFHTWSNMLARCYCKTHHAYDDYGGRGIRVCARWRERGGFGLRNFLRDLGPRPAGMTLDRINPQGHYEPTNCRWATPEIQSVNQRRFLWKDCAPPPVEKVRVMEARIEDLDDCWTSNF